VREAAAGARGSSRGSSRDSSRDSVRDSLRDELVHWAAIRPATGQIFARVVAPRGALSPTTTFHTRLDEATLAAGGTREALFADFAAWSRPGDVLCGWGHYGARLWRASGGTIDAPWIDLREAARRMQQGKVGTLEEYAASAAAPEVPPAVEGRAGARLAMIARILDAWRAMA
jgi:hypothetical protein